MTQLINQVNRPLLDKTVDTFYVSFYRMDNNAANILGRQVKNIGRPNLTFNYIETRNKGTQRFDSSRIEFAPVSIVFADDSSSLTTKALYQQLYIQNNIIQSDDKMFEIKVEAFDGQDNVIESFVLRDCFIETLSHSQQMVDTTTKNEITVDVRFSNVDYNFPDYS